LAQSLTFPPPVLTGSGSTGSQRASQPIWHPEVTRILCKNWRCARKYWDLNFKWQKL